MSRTGPLEIDVRVPRGDFDVAVSLTVGPGERLSLFGPSGAGKTTLLETVAGLVAPKEGGVRLGTRTLSGRAAKDEAPARPEIAMVRQPALLFPHLDVAANISYGRARPELASELARRLGVAHLGTARPAALSGGQAQRVALARALARDFSLLLLDEPMTGVDRASRPELWSAVEERCREQGAIALLVSHDLHEAQRFGDRVAVMDAGCLLQVGDPHQVAAFPTSRRAAEAVGFTRFLRIESLAGDEGLEVAIDPGSVHLGHRTEEGLVLPGIVASCHPAGSGFEIEVAVSPGAGADLGLAGEWRVATGVTLPILVGQRVEVGMEVLAIVGHAPVVSSRQSASGQSMEAHV